MSGRLREAGEAFRRALNVRPHGAWLIYDFARLLRSQASAQADARLLVASESGFAAGEYSRGERSGFVAVDWREFSRVWRRAAREASVAEE